MITQEVCGYSFRKIKIKLLKFSKRWKTLVKNQSGRKVKKLMTDSGLEFCNEAFDNYCAASSIVRHITTAGTP